MRERIFASDNAATVHPEILEAMTAANSGHAVAYGDDRWTHEATEIVRGHFGTEAQVFFVYNGTAANVLAVDACTRPTDAVICHEGSHLNVDECGAAERFTGAKLLPVAGANGKVSPQLFGELFAELRSPHQSRPRLVSVTQCTEVGTLYTLEELRAICAAAHELEMLVHMDGARLANAAAALGVGLRELTADVGIDLLSLGGTKNGMMFGEAVVFLRRDLADGFDRIRKQGMQLSSKLRFVAAQFSALFGGDLWRKNAAWANRAAARLAARLVELPDVELAYPVEANGVFARMPLGAIQAIQERYHFYTWSYKDEVVRLMCSFDTTEDDIDSLIVDLSRL